MTWPHRLHVAGATHPGRQRRANEDGFTVAEDLGLLVVADGVGGSAGGDVAARIAVDTVRDFFANPETTWPDDALEDPEEAGRRMLAAFSLANRRVREAARRDARLKGMATTLVAALALPAPGRICVAHVGDSPAYHHRGCRLRRLTIDHNVRCDAAAHARLGPETLGQLAPSLLTRAVGGADLVEPQVRIVEILPGDAVLLASDGLGAVVGEVEIAKVIDDHDDLGAAVAALIDRANARGGSDNITVVVGRWAYG